MVYHLFATIFWIWYLTILQADFYLFSQIFFSRENVYKHVRVWWNNKKNCMLKELVSLKINGFISLIFWSWV